MPDVEIVDSSTFHKESPANKTRESFKNKLAQLSDGEKPLM